jgi:hypothetical protein
MNPSALLSAVSPPLDQMLAEALLSEFLDVERRYVLADWEPATLNGGQLAEVASRLIYHIDSGNLNRRKSVDDCLTYVEDEKNSNSHAFPHRRSALHLCRTLRTLYKLRSQRGAVHIDPDYSANELDSALVVGLVRWIVAELLRIFWSGNTADVARAIREIVRFEVPAILTIDNRPLVLRTDCTVEEEILILLHNAGEKGMSRSELGSAVPKSAPATTTALQKLCSPSLREAVKRANGTYILTPNGSRRVHNQLGQKLALG